MGHSAAEIFAFVLLDIAVIIVVARLFGRAARALRQPAVVGEIVAGIALGPSLLGALPGDLDGQLFPPDVVPYLKVLAQLGLVLFMFIVGLELDVALLRGRERIAGSISLASIVVPFALGAASTLILHPLHGEVDGEQVSLFALMLFMGVAMSITAFPVLARILADRGMHRTTVGVLALASAAVDDVLAWTLLAFVVAVVKGGSPFEVVRIVALTVVFAAMMFGIARPLLVRLLGWYRRAGRLTPDILAVILVGVLLSAYVTEQIGIHAIFGAFVFGAVLPRENAQDLTREILERLEQVSVLLLLPIFFVVTGFGVDIAGLTGSGWWQLLFILSIAIGGKFVGAFGGARLQRMPVQQSAAIAVLMNTRGLTELVILSIGRELGVLDGELFTMMVLMALITTALTEPLLRLVYPDKAIERDIAAAARASFGSARTYRVLINLDGPPGPEVDGMLRSAGVAAAGRQPAELLLCRFLPAANEGRTGLEIGTGLLLPDLTGMAQAVEELEAYAATADTEARIKAICRFSSDSGADLRRFAEASSAEVVVVSEEWAKRRGDALLAFDAVTVLVVADHRYPDVADWRRAAQSTIGATAALALTSEGRVLVCADESPDGSRAALIAARAAAAAGAPLTAIAADGGGRVLRRLANALAPLGSVGIEAAVVSSGESAAFIGRATAEVVAAARVLDRTRGSAVNLREEVSALVKASVSKGRR
ncbi:cation:proton antiporter [Rhodococcus sp. NPDC058481]|uniref:cation:proton antiporter domain-containing protein n=1 Tax=unclassified Rhodococcus (in: high G+C Gram-positive bacteria) TaxID=192944 RepID=UPI00365EAEFB